MSIRDDGPHCDGCGTALLTHDDIPDGAYHDPNWFPMDCALDSDDPDEAQHHFCIQCGHKRDRFGYIAIPLATWRKLREEEEKKLLAKWNRDMRALTRSKA